MANQAIREAAKKAGVKLWMIADELSISEPSMTRKMRRELPEAEKVQLLKVISKLSENVRV